MASSGASSAGRAARGHPSVGLGLVAAAEVASVGSGSSVSPGSGCGPSAAVAGPVAAVAFAAGFAAGSADSDCCSTAAAGSGPPDSSGGQFGSWACSGSGSPACRGMEWYKHKQREIDTC